MKTRAWNPITSTGEIDEAELRRPAETAEPTTWEVAMPSKKGAARCAVTLAIQSMSMLDPRHTFRMVYAADAVMPGFDFAAYPNITIAVGPLRTQAEADCVLPALLAVKAARREAVFAPTEEIDINRAAWGEGFPRPPLDVQARQIAPSGMPAWREGFLPIRALDAVRVRGGSTPMHPAWVRSLRDQATAAGVSFSLRWGEWVPEDGAPLLDRQAWWRDGHVLEWGSLSPAGKYSRNWTPWRRDGEVAVLRVSAARSGCMLDGVEYPEVL